MIRKNNASDKIKFNEYDLSSEEVVLMHHEKRLQYLLYKGEYKEVLLQHNKCINFWRKYLNTEKMKQGSKMSDKSYSICLENLKRIK